MIYEFGSREALFFRESGKSTAHFFKKERKVSAILIEDSYPNGIGHYYIFFHLSSTVTYEIKIHSASVFDKSDCSILTSCKSDDYGAKWILQNVKSCRDFHKNVWFGKKKTNEQFIIFDMGSERKIKEIQILNNFDMSTTFSKW